jgi:hypothetical protein
VKVILFPKMIMTVTTTRVTTTTPKKVQTLAILGETQENSFSTGWLVKLIRKLGVSRTIMWESLK